MVWILGGVDTREVMSMAPPAQRRKVDIFFATPMSLRGPGVAMVRLTCTNEIVMTLQPNCGTLRHTDVAVDGTLNKESARLMPDNPKRLVTPADPNVTKRIHWCEKPVCGSAK